jgi:hypothetical protein
MKGSITLLRLHALSAPWIAARHVNLPLSNYSATNPGFWQHTGFLEDIFLPFLCHLPRYLRSSICPGFIERILANCLHSKRAGWACGWPADNHGTDVCILCFPKP